MEYWSLHTHPSSNYGSKRKECEYLKSIGGEGRFSTWKESRKWILFRKTELFLNRIFMTRPSCKIFESMLFCKAKGNIPWSNEIKSSRIGLCSFDNRFPQILFWHEPVRSNQISRESFIPDWMRKSFGVQKRERNYFHLLSVFTSVLWVFYVLCWVFIVYSWYLVLFTL